MTLLGFIDDVEKLRLTHDGHEVGLRDFDRNTVTHVPTAIYGVRSAGVDEGEIGERVGVGGWR